MCDIYINLAMVKKSKNEFWLLIM